MNMERRAERLMEVLEEIINCDGRPWREKKADLLDHLGTEVDAIPTVLMEFLSWFSEDMA